VRSDFIGSGLDDLKTSKIGYFWIWSKYCWETVNIGSQIKSKTCYLVELEILVVRFL